MIANKKIISLVLLVSFLTGFAHNLTPHFSTFDTSGSIGIPHEHLKNKEGLIHLNHYDAGLWDLLYCMWEHIPDKNLCTDHHFTPYKEKKSFRNNKRPVKILALIPPTTEILPLRQILAVNYYYEIIPASISTPEHLQRGPPVS